MRALVGYTGFVGQNLDAQGTFEARYNSKNIADAFETSPHILYFCGIGAQKFKANADPAADLAVVRQAMENIERIRPRTVVLISTVDVYPVPRVVDEDSVIETDAQQPYGFHRRMLEQFVQQNFAQHLIVRLPGLYGLGLKKNFLFDSLTYCPALIKEQRMDTLDKNFLQHYYIPSENGFYKLRENISKNERALLRTYFENCGFSALSFTDSRAVFQMYNLSYLYAQICQALERDIQLLNITTEPVSAEDIHRAVTGQGFTNHLAGDVPCYDMRSKWAAALGGQDGYLFGRDFVLNDIAGFARDWKEREEARA